MASRPKLTRWDLMWIGVAVAVLVMVAVAARTPFFGLFRLVFAGGLVILCISEWRTKGHGWLPTLSWTVPLGVPWSAAQALIDRPLALVLLTYWVGFAVMLTMLISTRAATWWYEVVLRRPYK